MTETLPAEFSASTSSSPPCMLCAICNDSKAVYTCPRCRLRTCTLSCSSAHKTRDQCSGVRNRAQYVPMKQYGWGTMMDDYVFLEDIGRKVSDWGREITVGGFLAGGQDRGRGGIRGGSRGRGRGGQVRGDRRHQRPKRDILKLKLEMWDIDMDLLPVGMHRRQLNQSGWDAKSDKIFLTVEFNFHPPKDPLAPSQSPPAPFTLLFHRNTIDTPLLSLLQKCVSDRVKSKKESTIPPWIPPLILPDATDPESFVCPQCFMRADLDLLPGSRPKNAYYKLDPTQKLVQLLRNTHFVEFPTIEVWEEGEFAGTIVDKRGSITQYEDDGVPAKRRKLNAKARKKALSGLLGGYGSEEDGEDEDESNMLSLLGDYAESDEEGPFSRKTQEHKVEEASLENAEDDDDDLDAEGETDDELELDPATLLELVRQAQTHRGTDDDEAIDWSDSSDVKS